MESGWVQPACSCGWKLGVCLLPPVLQALARTNLHYAHVRRQFSAQPVLQHSTLD